MKSRNPLNDNHPDQRSGTQYDGSSTSPTSQFTPIQELLSFDFEETPESAKLPASPYVRSEVNFLRYPFFVLTTRDIHKIDRIEYEEEREDSAIYWKVSRNIDHIPSDLVVDRWASEIEGSFRLDFLFLDDVWSHDLLENNFSNINRLRFYH